jgi:outer membrane protein TolC
MSPCRCRCPCRSSPDLLQRDVDGSTADAELALQADQRLQLAREVANDASALVALKAEQALLGQELKLAAALLQLQRERRESQHATGADVDDAQRLRVKLVAEALDVDDDLDRARRKLLATVGGDAIDDDLEARCSQGLPPVQQLVDAAISASPKRAAAQALRRAVEHEDQAWKLGFLPWPKAVEGTWINRDRLRVDDYRLRLDINVPLLHAFDGTHDGLTLRQRAAEQEATLAEQQVRDDVAALHETVTRRQALIREMALDTASAPPTDPAEALETQLANLQAQRRRVRALGRCAASVTELQALSR